MLCLKGSVFCFVSVSFAENLDVFIFLIARFIYLCPKSINELRFEIQKLDLSELTSK